jgi:predicted transposase YbfD/YdcC
MLGQIETDEKSNEITAIPKLLQMLELKGAIVTLDAMGTQKEIAQTIRDREGDYVMALKGNQNLLYEEVQQYWEDPRLPPPRSITNTRPWIRGMDVWKCGGIE